jgi:hypothetical protein
MNRNPLVFIALLAAAFPVFPNPSCVDPVNVHYARTVQSCTSPFPCVNQDFFGYNCGNGNYMEYDTYSLAIANQHLSDGDAKKLITNYWVSAYSSTAPSSFHTWGSTSAIDNAIAANPQYNPLEFSISYPYPNVAPAFPFNGTSDDLSYPLSIAYPNLCRAAVTVTYTPDPRYFAKLFIFPGKGNTQLFDKPIIVGDAFDPSNGRNAWAIYGRPDISGGFGTPQYKNLLSLSGNAPRDKGYDVLFVDFSQGGGDILINAGILLKFVEWIQTQSNAKIIVGGPSMSGIVARLALLYSLPGNNTTGTDLGAKVKGYMSIDSPHQGASLDATMQAAVYSLTQDSDINGLVGFANFFGAGQENTSIGQWQELSVPASYEMLYSHHNIGAGTSTESHDKFYAFLNGLGNYRKSFPSTAIAYSNFTIPHQALNHNTIQKSGEVEVHFPYPPQQTLATRSYTMGGPLGDSRRYELAPGSTGNWYFSPYSYNSPTFVQPNFSINGAFHDNFFLHCTVSPFRNGTLCPSWYDGYGYTQSDMSKVEMYKGTFIPIQSSLDLKNFDVYAPAETDGKKIAAYSPFDMVYYMEDPYNHYRSEFSKGSATGTSPNDKRYEHIVFGSQLISAMDKALDYIETHPKSNIVPILYLLLN